MQHIPLFKEDDAKDPQSLLNQQLHAGSVGNQFGSKHTVRNERFEELVSCCSPTSAWPIEDSLCMLTCQGKPMFGNRKGCNLVRAMKLKHAVVSCILGALKMRICGKMY